MSSLFDCCSILVHRTDPQRCVPSIQLNAAVLRVESASEFFMTTVRHYIVTCDLWSPSRRKHWQLDCLDCVKKPQGCNVKEFVCSGAEAEFLLDSTLNKYTDCSMANILYVGTKGEEMLECSEWMVKNVSSVKLQYRWGAVSSHIEVLQTSTSGRAACH